MRSLSRSLSQPASLSASAGFGTVTHSAGALIANQLLLGNGLDDLKTFAPGIAGQFLKTGTPPTWASPVPWVNVTDAPYSAVGDGTTNNYVGITAAIAAAGVGGTVYFPAGTYLTNFALMPLEAQHWLGAGMRASYIKQGSSVSNGIVYIDAAPNCRISDLGFKGNASNPAAATAIGFNSTDCTIERCYNDVNCQRFTIVFSDRCRIAQNYSDGTTNSHSIELNGASYCTVEDNVILNPALNGIEVYALTTVGGINGVFFPANAPNLGARVLRNVVSGCGAHGIDALGAHYAAIHDNIVSNTTQQGITILANDFDPTIASQYCSVNGNAVIDAGTEGIDIDGPFNTIEGNKVVSAGTYGFYVPGSYNTIVGNVSRSNGTIGFRIEGSYSRVIGNTAADNSANVANASDGFSFTGDNNHITDNVSTDTRAGGSRTQRGGLILNAGSDGNRVLNNRIFNNISFDYLDSGATNTVLGLNQDLTALGGGAAATMGTIGATGPATAGQNKWIRCLDSAGAAFWVPVWK